MSKAMQLVGIILLGIFTLVIINLMNDVRSTNELDYYLLQETVEASMYDAVDYSFYRDTALLKVDFIFELFFPIFLFNNHLIFLLNNVNS